MNFDRLRQRLDVDRLRRGVDLDRLRQSVDLDRLRRSVDLDRLRQRVDLDLLRQKVDLDRLRRSAELDRLRRSPAVDRLRRSAVVDRVANADPVTRRRLLLAVPGAAGALLLAGGASATAAPGPTATAKPRPVKPHRPKSAAAAAHHRPAAQRRPVFTLGDYRRVVPGPAFPSDAVALTIDDGPHPVWTPKILDLLERYHVPALFCMIGNQVRGHEGVARSVIRAGHHLANHTWSHPSGLAHQSPVSVHKQIYRAQEEIHDTTGYVPKLFRSPGGAWSGTVLHEAAKSGLIPLDWSDDPRDWTKPGTTAITRRLLAARPGQILLCHDGGGDRSQTYAALCRVIPALRARGYRFVAL